MLSTHSCAATMIILASSKTLLCFRQYMAL